MQPYDDGFRRVEKLKVRKLNQHLSRDLIREILSSEIARIAAIEYVHHSTFQPGLRREK